ncbi:hypothetical protein DWG18_00895 [Lysobacter sp. TY2-98]|uniref:lipopolysaccharide biosynthesis protein n=1 Tax=Lysobacter sp. TY2-98 TaxID=2290922 RepID=UPI000E207B7D|nr:oligosaccharide flippase family protein [Lysobacter sp. TY2-98]AXK70985.1 hypothetical protein DWG18_00895 [Lysobacter sp. TY2-98]
MKATASAAHILSSLIGHRGRHLLRDGAWSAVAKAASAGNLLLSVPLALASLGPLRFGVWATLVSLTTFGGFLDFGFGNGAMNLVAGARGREAHEEVGVIVDAARRSLLRIAAKVAIVSAALVLLLPWGRLLHLPEIPERELRLCVAVVASAIVVGIPLNLSTRVLLGIGEGGRAFRWQALAQATSLALIALIAQHTSSLLLLVTAAVAGPLLGAVASTIELTTRLPPWNSAANLHDLETRIRGEGQLFFVLQLAAAVAFGLDLTLITRLAGPEAAGGFAVVQRAFSIVSLSLGLLWAPLWPTYRQALAAGHRQWVSTTLRRSVIGALLYAVVAGSILAVGLMLGREHGVAVLQQASTGLILGFALWTVADAVGGAISTFFNAASVMRYQVIVALVLAAACLAAKAWAIGRFGATAAPWATFFVYVSISLFPTALLGRWLVRNAFLKKHY